MSNNYSVRNVTEADAALLRHLASRCAPLDLHTHYTYWVLCKFFNKSCFVLSDGEKPAGFITAIDTADRVFYWQIGLLKDYRGKGCSALLIDSVAKYAKEIGKNASVSIAEDNKSSYNAFRSYCEKHEIGFRQNGSLAIGDLDVPGFCEEEIIYDIVFNEKKPQVF